MLKLPRASPYSEFRIAWKKDDARDSIRRIRRAVMKLWAGGLAKRAERLGHAGYRRHPPEIMVGIADHVARSASTEPAAVLTGGLQKGRITTDINRNAGP